MDPISTMTGISGALAMAGQVTGRLKAAGDTVGKTAQYIKNGSLTDITRAARVEPLTLVDADCMNVEFLPEVMQSLQSIFSGYYLQAINMIGNVGGVSVAKKLAPLNPNRSMGMESHVDWRMASESYKYRLPTTHNKLAMVFEGIAMENMMGPNAGPQLPRDPMRSMAQPFPVNGKNGTRPPPVGSPLPYTRHGSTGGGGGLGGQRQHYMPEPAAGKDPMAKVNMPEVKFSPSMTTDKDAFRTMSEATNLSVGKMYNVTLREGEITATIPVSIRLMVSTMPTATMVNLFSFKDTFDMDMGERVHAWRAGRLEFIKDLVMCKDLVDKHRKAAIGDKSGIYAKILGRENSNKIAGALNRSPSLATASNLAVVSSDTIAQIEQRLNGKFSSFKIRQTVFDNTNLMILAVIDKNWERVTFYHRGMDSSTQVSVRDMKVANKDGGSSGVMDIMKAYMSGSAPQL